LLLPMLKSHMEHGKKRGGIFFVIIGAWFGYRFCYSQNPFDNVVDLVKSRFNKPLLKTLMADLLKLLL
jgi:hypothetical protein